MNGYQVTILYIIYRLNDNNDMTYIECGFRIQPISLWELLVWGTAKERNIQGT